MDYAAFLHKKTHLSNTHGFEPVWMQDFLFDFQQSLVEHALITGRSAKFADCGLGKTPMELVYGETVLTPFLGVGSEAYSAVMNGRRAIGAELKPSYYRQAVKNLAAAATGGVDSAQAGLDLFADLDTETM